MPTADAGFSVKEAAAIVGVPELAVRKAITTRGVAPRITERGRAVRYRFAAQDLVFVKLVTSFPLALPRFDKAPIRAVRGGRGRSPSLLRLRDVRRVASGC